MKKLVIVCLLLGVFAAGLALTAWPYLFGIRHYTLDELIGLNCEELGEKQEEVIFAYHDASLAHYHRTGAFEDDLGLPKEEVLPFVILMKKVIQDNAFTGFDLSKPFFPSASASTPRLHSEFYAEISRLCATSPSLDAIEAMGQAATNLAFMR
ncbi:MAG: hypothetical protein NWQ23_07395 [Yoonia sp.]|uniref:hypothetical protein n=1 Tax=Yoonia sp. TaxID=2212373 RepID=UPI00273FCA46|nr:hypothetical protein [Yoonia sp.]MDP5085229.1 hypothetical protein [Yoonia sp.]